jgi:hypothetical protein
LESNVIEVIRLELPARGSSIPTPVTDHITPDNGDGKGPVNLTVQDLAKVPESRLTPQQRVNLVLQQGHSPLCDVVTCNGECSCGAPDNGDGHGDGDGDVNILDRVTDFYADECLPGARRLTITSAPSADTDMDTDTDTAVVGVEAAWPTVRWSEVGRSQERVLRNTPLPITLLDDEAEDLLRPDLLGARRLTIYDYQGHLRVELCLWDRNDDPESEVPHLAHWGPMYKLASTLRRAGFGKHVVHRAMTEKGLDAFMIARAMICFNL